MKMAAPTVRPWWMRPGLEAEMQNSKSHEQRQRARSIPPTIERRAAKFLAQWAARSVPVQFPLKPRGRLGCCEFIGPDTASAADLDRLVSDYGARAQAALARFATKPSPSTVRTAAWSIAVMQLARQRREALGR
jgi:hypothetical protein